MIPPPPNSIAGRLVGDNYSYFYKLAEDKVINTFHHLSKTDDDDVLCIGSSKRWLAFERRRDGYSFLWNPITGRKINLPCIHLLPQYYPDDFDIFNTISSIVLSSSCPDAEDCRVMIIYYMRKGENLAFSTTPGRGSITTSSCWTCLHNPLRCYNNLVYFENQ
ncbi:hypothetical protein ACH5RR_039707 [Cinchona calisaya]|uniref:KIB1-4 beta-propeller domain-containing protein n=1 Tax=Cinchona calisaya TaxID=153742 RepID=A0ABD2Y4B6_9GENT